VRRRRVITRPWNDDEELEERPRVRRRHSTDADDDPDDPDDDCVIDEEIDVDDVHVHETTTTRSKNHQLHHITSVTHSQSSGSAATLSTVCPLDALLRMTSQPFDDSASPGQTTIHCRALLAVILQA